MQRTRDPLLLITAMLAHKLQLFDEVGAHLDLRVLQGLLALLLEGGDGVQADAGTLTGFIQFIEVSLKGQVLLDAILLPGINRLLERLASFIAETRLTPRKATTIHHYGIVVCPPRN